MIKEKDPGNGANPVPEPTADVELLTSKVEEISTRLASVEEENTTLRQQLEQRNDDYNKLVNKFADALFNNPNGKPEPAPKPEPEPEKKPVLFKDLVSKDFPY